MKKRSKKATAEPMRLSDLEALIENIVRAQAPQVADCWFWGSPGSSGARGADHRTIYAYWKAAPERHREVEPRMIAVHDALESLDAVEEVRVHDYEPDTGYTGKPVIGEQWEIHLTVDIS